MSLIFLDSADSNLTKEVLEQFPHLAGQTTNPSLLAKALGDKDHNLLDFYKEQIEIISSLLPGGSVSIEVYADEQTTSEEMLQQAKEFNSWIPNAHIKFPCIPEGIEAASTWIYEGGKANITLVFSLAQIQKIVEISKDSQPGQVLISPFIGRLEDINIKGLELIKHAVQYKKEMNSNVSILAASVRNAQQCAVCVDLGADILTIPSRLIVEGVDTDTVSIDEYYEDLQDMKSIPFELVDVVTDEHLWHPLTKKGLQKFADDWNEAMEQGK